MMQTIGEQRHAAVMEASLRRIADALERIANALDSVGANDNDNEKGEQG